MDAAGLLLIATRWLHTVAAVLMLGAVLFELLALRPGPNGGSDAGPTGKLDAANWEIIQTALTVFLISGAILTFERLSRGAAGGYYVVLLGLKLLLTVAMFQIAFRLRGTEGQHRVLKLRWVAGLGLLILLATAVLKSVYERALLA